MSNRKPIESLAKTGPYSFQCKLKPVRELESYTAELEKKLEIAVDLIKSVKHGLSIAGSFELTIKLIDKDLVKIQAN